MKDQKAFQDYYPDGHNHCYGCGTRNTEGLKIKSFWDGNETVAYFTPQSFHTSFPGFVYGGLLASLVDCHCIASAAAAAYRSENRSMGTEPFLRYVTASLKIDYLRPTPIDTTLEIRGRIKEIKGKKVVVEASVLSEGTPCAKAEVIAVKIPESMDSRRESQG